MFHPLRGAGACAVGAATLCVCASAANAAVDRVCRPATSVAAVAAAAHVGRGDIRIVPSVGGNGEPQCTFAPSGHGRRPSVTVNVDSAPQAAWRLSRAVTEASQLFGPPPPGWKPPIGLNGLGPDASWFPELDALMATNGVDLVTVDVNWPRASLNAKIALARRIVVPFRRSAR
jgi:hypothetical protein